MIKLMLIVGTGSFLGGCLRYLVSVYVKTQSVTPFPLGTFLANFIGCFLIGLLYSYSGKFDLSSELKLFLGVGILGGFTTFSAFSYEAVSLFRNDQPVYALLYIAASLLICLSATFFAIYLGKTLF